MMKRNIAVLGTGSDVGKSILGAALCRSFADKGIKVAPFKAQNMSNNSGITPEGLEMGRAQIVQAEAAKVAPHVHMNPILLKPTGEKQSQVILHGLVHENQTAMDYHKNKKFYFKQACMAFDKLASGYDRIVLEGAGSCAEVNLMKNDIVNFSMAEYANADVILAADIHRGGVFAQIVGTLKCLPQKYRDMVKGIIINRFRGDISLFKDGTEWIESKTGIRVLGVLPWYTHFKIDAEDSVEIEKCNNFSGFNNEKPSIGIIRLPHIANFTDFHALTRLKSVQTIFFDTPEHLEKFNAVIIPGSKNTREDLKWLMERFEGALKAYRTGKGNILGICGGYQMLGTRVLDPHGLEGAPGESKALGLLPLETVLKAPKTTTISDFKWGNAAGKGYEIHMGITTREQSEPLVHITARNGSGCSETDGCISADKKVMGSYIHGFFDSKAVLLKWFDLVNLDIKEPIQDMYKAKQKDYDLLKIHFESHMDMSLI